MRTGYFKKGFNCIWVVVSMFLVCCLLCGTVLEVSAAGWVDKTGDVYEMLYGQKGEPDPGADSAVQEEEPGMIEDFFSGLITSLSKQLNNLLSSHDLNLSIDGIVFGRMAASVAGTGYVEADFTHFGLEENNPWGIIGATIFYALRNLCLVVLPIILLVLLILELFQNTAKGRARLKELCMHTVYVFGLLFVLPYALDLFIYFRDVVLFSVHRTMNGLVVSISGNTNQGSVGIVEMMLGIQDGRILNALVLLASVCAGLFFLIDYIRIALLLTLAFGLFPVIAVMSFWNHKKLSEWSNVFFPNLLVPFVDMLLVLIPTVLNALFVRLFGNGLNSVLVGLIILIVMWNVVMVRNRVIKLLGFDGMGGGGGFGQMLETLSHLGHHYKKEEHKTEQPQRDKEVNRADNRNAEGGSYTERSSVPNEEMGPAVNSVINSEQEGPNDPQDVSRTDTDAMLADMDEQRDMAVNGEENISPVYNQMPGEGREISSEEGEESADSFSLEIEEARTVSPNPMEGQEVERSYGQTEYRDMRENMEPARIRSSPDEPIHRMQSEENRKDAPPGRAKEAAKKVAKTSAKIAVGGAFGIAGTFAAGYGGMGTSVGSGIVSAHGGTRLVEGGFNALEHAPETVEQNKQHVKEAVLDAYRRDYQIFGAGAEDFDLWTAQKEAKKHAAKGAREAQKKREALEREAKDAYKAAEEKAYKDFID